MIQGIFSGDFSSVMCMYIGVYLHGAHRMWPNAHLLLYTIYRNTLYVLIDTDPPPPAADIQNSTRNIMCASYP